MDRLDQLSVRGFKSIRDLEGFKLEDLNVLIGSNGAGKSNLLSLFRMLESIMAKRLQVFAKEEGGSESLLFRGKRHTSTVAILLSFVDGRSQYQISLAPSANGFELSDEWIQSKDAEKAKLIAQSTHPVEEDLLTWPEGHREARAAEGRGSKFGSDILASIKHWRVYSFQDASCIARAQPPSVAHNSRLLQADGGNLGQVLRYLQRNHPSEYRQIIHVVQLASPYFGSFVHDEEGDASKDANLKWIHVGDDGMVLASHQLSGCTLRFLCLATLLLQPPEMQPTLILVDEPELGLHSLAITLLAEMLQTASEQRQVIVATQSADLISEFEPKDVVVVERVDGESRFTRLDESDLSEWLEEYSLGDLWKMHVLEARPLNSRK